MSARPRAGVDFNSPRLLADVHSLVNARRVKIGLPEWDFSREPEQQWWKKIPLIAEMVQRKLLSLVGDKYTRAAFLAVTGTRGNGYKAKRDVTV